MFDFNNLGGILNVTVEMKGRFSNYHPKYCKLKVKYMFKLFSILVFLKAKCFSVVHNNILQLQRQQHVLASDREKGQDCL